MKLNKILDKIAETKYLLTFLNTFAFVLLVIAWNHGIKTLDIFLCIIIPVLLISILILYLDKDVKNK